MNFHEMDDRFGQEVVNRSYEKAWKKGKKKPSLEDFNKDWTKVAGKHNKYKKLPKYDANRGLKKNKDIFFSIFN